MADPHDSVYDGFISYSHAADDLLAPRLQAGLQRFAKPWWQRRAMRVFRDESSLSANPHLWSSITEALDTSGWFVLLLSPDAAQSEWVNQEVAYWVEHKDPSRILPVVTAGEFGWSDGDVTGDAVPEALRGIFAEEPRWVDMRWAKEEDQLDLQDPRFADAVADIASAIRGVPKDDLAGEEVRQHRRTVRTVWAAGAVVVLLGVVATVAAVQAVGNAREAEELAQAEAAARSDADEQRAVAEANAEAEAEARQEADANAQRADAEATAAREAEALAAARELASSAIATVEADPRLATWLALLAIDEALAGDEPPVEVVNALWRATAADPLVDVIDHGFGGETFVDLSPDGRLIAVSAAEGAAVQLRSSDSLEIIWEYSEETEDSFTRPVFSPDGAFIALPVVDSEALYVYRLAGTDDRPNRVVVLDTESGETVEVLEFPDCVSVEGATWSPDGSQLAVGIAPPGCPRADAEGSVWVEVFDTASWSSIGVIDKEASAEVQAPPRWPCSPSM